MQKTVFPNADKTCRFCKYYDLITNVELKTQMAVCRKNAPRSTAQLINTVAEHPVTKQPTQVMQWQPFTLWPIIAANDWCGEFTRAPHEVGNPASTLEVK